jgi:hypothetical protein
MSQGGARPGAGRPVGRRDSYQRTRRRTAADASASPAPPESLPEPFDPAGFDLITELKRIACDPRSGGVGRVQACKLLAELTKPAEGDRVPVIDRVSARAIELLARKGLH